MFLSLGSLLGHFVFGMAKCCIRALLVIGGFVSYPVTVTLRRRNIRRRLLKATTGDVYEVTGNLCVDETGCFVNVNASHGVMKVRISEQDAFKLLVGNDYKPRGQILETRLPTSLAVKSPLPKGQFAIKSADGETHGYGFRVRRGSTHGFITAKHVMAKCLLVEQPAIYGPTKGYPIDPTWKVVIDPKGVDWCMVEVPVDVFTALQIGIMGIGRTPSVGAPLRVHGHSPHGTIANTGVVTKVNELKFAHLCSTVPGYSGAPVLFNGMAVGVHVRGDDTKNWAYSLDWLLSLPETPSKEKGFNRDLVPDDSASFDVVDITMGRAAMKRVRHRNKAYSVEDLPVTLEYSGNSWADMLEEEYDFGDDYGSYGRMESSDFQAGPMPSASLSEDTNGKPSTSASAGQVPESISKTSDTPEPVRPSLDKENETPSPEQSSTPSPPSEATVGPAEAVAMLNALLSSMGSNIESVPPQLLKSLKKWSNSSVPPTPVPRVPQAWVEILAAQGILVSAKRRSLTPPEMAILRLSGITEAELQAFVENVPKSTSKGKKKKSNATPTPGSPGASSDPQTDNS
nr:MAG: hypothetical protein 1 [Barnaviridae sp.]